MKRCLGIKPLLCVLSAVVAVENALAQNASFSQMNGLQPLTTSAPAENGNFMSEEDMNFGSDNDVNFEPSAAISPSVQRNLQTPVAPPPSKVNVGMDVKGDTLTETLQQQDQQKLSGVKLPDVSGTWVDQLASSVPQAIASKSQENAENGSDADETLNSLMDNSRGRGKRSNASVFDISGIMLRMNLAQAEKAMMVRGFKRVSQKMEIPNFIKWRNEETCRNNGVVGYERLMNCVVEIAKKNNYQYVETAKYAKYSTKEEVEIKLTSNFTGNKIYRIMYKSMSGKVVGSGAKAAYLRNIKVYDFWKKVNQKYGNPDNKEEVTWGLGMNKPYMKASTGFLVLEDPMLRELDYTRMSREDQRFMNTDLYSF